MWSTSPKLVAQPAVEMYGTATERFGYQLSDNPGNWRYRLSNAQVLYGAEVGGDSGGTFGCLHLYCDSLPAEGRVWMILKTGHYFLAESLVADGTNGLGSIVSAAPWQQWRYIRIRLYNSFQEESASAVIGLPVDLESGLVLNCGYALTADGWVLYGFAAHGRVHWYQAAGWGAPATVGSPHFGYGTACLRIAVQEADINSQIASQVQYYGPGFLTIKSIAAHHGPFATSRTLAPDSLAARSESPYERFGSLRSKACAFASPEISFQPNAHNGFDHGGHPEVRWLGLWPASLAGQPNSDIAYVCRNAAWRSNIFSDPTANELFARVRVTWQSNTTININGHFFSVPEGVVDCDSGEYGNNEYSGQSSAGFQVNTYGGPELFVGRKAFVGISLYETVSSATDLTSASVGYYGSVVVGAFYMHNSGQVSLVSFFSFLTQADIDLLASGGTVFVQGGDGFNYTGPGLLSVGIQGIGPS